MCETQWLKFKDISDTNLNSPLELPESNTALVMATDIVGSAQYWVLQVVGGHDVQHERNAELRATDTGAELIAHYER